MLSTQIIARGIKNPSVLKAFRQADRHFFVPAEQQKEAYEDTPLPIGSGQTISQPYIVALMTELLLLQSTDRVLEVGTGCGYQAAILGMLSSEVHSMEIIPELASRAELRLLELGHKNIFVHCGDGHRGFPEKAPFDKIIVTAAPPEIPQALTTQLKTGGILVIPVGGGTQKLLRLTKTETGLQSSEIIPVRFVPMIRESQR